MWHVALPSVCLSVHLGSVLVVAGSWCLAGAQEVASPFSIMVAPESRWGQMGADGDRGTCPPALGHRTAQVWREGLDVAQISWKGSASGSSAKEGASRQGGPWYPPGTVLAAPLLPPHGSGGGLVGPAILRAL